MTYFWPRGRSPPPTTNLSGLSTDCANHHFVSNQMKRKPHYLFCFLCMANGFVCKCSYKMSKSNIYHSYLIHFLISEMRLWFGRQVGSIRFITGRRSMLASVTRSCPHLWRAGEIMWRFLRNAGRLPWCTYSVSWSDTASMAGGTTPSTKNNSGKPWAHGEKVWVGPGLNKKT